MSKEIISVSTETTIKEAIQLCETHKVRHLPVLENGELIGIVTDRDLRLAQPSSFAIDQNQEEIHAKKITEIMTVDVITTHPLDFIEEAAFTMYASQVGCLPVMSQQQLIGIVTQADLLHALVILMGVDQPSSVVQLQVEDKPGQLASTAQLIKECKVNITNVLSYPSTIPGKANLKFRLRTMDPRKVIQRLEENNYEVIWPDFYEG